MVFRRVGFGMMGANLEYAELFGKSLIHASWVPKPSRSLTIHKGIETEDLHRLFIETRFVDQTAQKEEETSVFRGNVDQSQPMLRIPRHYRV